MTSWVRELNIPVVEDKHYWFIRTTGGDHYDDFLINNYVAIGWDYVSVDLLRSKPEELVKLSIQANVSKEQALEDDEAEEIVDADEWDSCTPPSIKKAVTLIYNKIKRFVDEIAVGDIILIPSKNSDRLSIGVVSSSVYEDNLYVQNYYSENPYTETVPCPFLKRRRVIWLKHINKRDLDIFLSKAIAAQHSISCIDDAASLINRSIYNFYATENDIHAIIRAGHPNGLSFAELVSFVNCLDAALLTTSEAMDEKYDPNELDAKIAIHSPGILELTAAFALSGTVVTFFILALSHYRHGGKTKMSFSSKIAGQEVNLSFESETKGTLTYKQEQREFNLQAFNQLLDLEERLGIEYPDIRNSEDL